MVTIVVVINIFISLMLLYVALRVWQLKKQIVLISDRLLDCERCSHELLYQAPTNINLAQQNIQNLRQSKQGLQMQIQQVRQIISLLLLGQRTWGRYISRPVPITPKKPPMRFS
ncbi:hypothetical protein WDZ92_33195 [Nostoc sp. NIES-2111]